VKLFAWIGYLKPEIEAIPQDVQRLTSDFLAQPSIKIHFAGPLREPSGKRSGMMMIFEHDSREDADAFVAESPYQMADLYERYGLYEYDNEVG